MPLDEARVQDIRDGYESRIAGLRADLAASRALVEKMEKGLGHAIHLTEHNRAMCVRCREAKSKIAEARALAEADMLERLK